MGDVFKRLEADENVEVQGVHWASLINAWGCVKKDLDKAISIFESITSHPGSRQARVPDAVTFEALINVLATHRRIDLIPGYVDRLKSFGVHMTAYIANCLIKGFAIVGDLEQARSVFEQLSDPPAGVAAPNNHAPHDASASSHIPLTAPVYREVSHANVLFDFKLTILSAINVGGHGTS
jgi:pentatricopeptide repeat protein